MASTSGGASRIIINDFPDAKYVGKSLQFVATDLKTTPVDAAIWLQLNGADRAGGARMRGFSLAEIDMDHIMQQEFTATCTDGGIATPGEGLPHARFYGTTARNLVCVEYLTGNLKWEDPSAAPGSLCYADERLYLHGESGEVVLIEATSQAYREKGRFTPPDLPDHGGRSPKAWAHPVIANGRLYIRDLNLLLCYDIKAK